MLFQCYRLKFAAFHDMVETFQFFVPGSHVFGLGLGLFFHPLLFGQIPRDFGESRDPAGVVPSRHDDIVGPESGAILADSPSFPCKATIALRRQKDGSPVESIILGNVIAFVIGLPFMIGIPPPSPTGIAAIVALGVVQLGFSYWLYARAIRQVTALEAVIIPVIEPILNPVWVFLARGEKPSRWALLGGIIVLSAVTLRAYASVRMLHTSMWPVRPGPGANSPAGRDEKDPD